MEANQEQITLGGGCFWCLEAVFQRIMGVTKVVSGYSGGSVPNPTYAQVCENTTGHAEVVQLTFDNSQISLDEILDIFWHLHDPTTPNRQGNDQGEQYRSVIFYHTDHQKQIVERSMQALTESGVYNNPVVTQIQPLENFYPAEDYHQDYYNQNRNQPYCRLIIDPKIKKLLAQYQDNARS
jgi:peptide-methionine (S)-S-oxide reductase